MRTSATIAVLAAAAASAATIRVDVGKSGLTFSPSTITAAKGDILDFHFFPINHSVVAGDFNSPCRPATTGGFFSGFVPVKSGSGEGPSTFQVAVTSTDPTVFYCAQNVGSHCASGMAAVVNPSGSQTLEAYTSAARAVSAAVAPNSGPFGGVAGSGSTPSGTAATGGSPTCTPSSGGSGGYRFKRANTCGNAAGSLKAPLGAAGGLVAVVGIAVALF